MKNIIFSIFSSLLFTFYAMAQNSPIVNDSSTITEQIKIVLKAKNTGNKIILRWAPTSAGAWHMSNSKGYMIEKMVYKNDSSSINKSFQIITPDTLRPWPLEDWQSIVKDQEEDKYAAIAAQTIHGKRNASAFNSKANFIQKSRELKNLYGASLLAAEFSRDAALASALRYEDSIIDPSLSYVYKVYSNASNKYYKIDTAYVVVEGNAITKNIKPIIAKVEEGEKLITLKWDVAFKEDYSAWFIEKSTDNGSTYNRLTKDPYIHSFNNLKNVDYFVFHDSVKTLYKKNMYRIIGINTFAELSEPSDPIVAMGRDKTPPPTPNSIIAEQMTESQLQITWQADTSPDLKGFYITKASAIGSEEKLITNELLSPDTRSYKDEFYDQLKNNWYQVYAIDTVGNAVASYPTFGAVRDDFAPSKPSQIQGSIDTLGVVSLHWKLGKERDVFGYNVYSANSKDHVFSRLTPKPIRDTIYLDTIKLKVLTEEIYYKIKAVDIRGNGSIDSDILTLKKPDIVPPVAPIFNTYKVQKEGIHLAWATSSSKDIKTHYLYRNKIDEDNWKLIYQSETIEKQGAFIDSNTETGATYSYKLVAEDDDGLTTNGVQQITLTAIDFEGPLAVKKIVANTTNQKKQIVIKWEYSQKGAYLFHLYKAKNGGGFSIVKTLKQTELQYVDIQVDLNSSYEYAVQVQYPKNNKSGFSPITKINIQ